MEKKGISDATREAILDAAWELVVRQGRLDVAQAEIAAAAGVSRQSLYLAFGSRAGLWTAMTQHHDAGAPQIARLQMLGTRPRPDWQTLEDFIATWCDYLPVIYPVAVLLDAAAITDKEAAAAWDDRMKGALLRGFKGLCKALEEAGGLAPGWNYRNAAQLCWSLVHLASYRLLVVECGWSREAFLASRLQLLRATLKAPADAGAQMP